MAAADASNSVDGQWSPLLKPNDVEQQGINICPRYWGFSGLPADYNFKLQSQIEAIILKSISLHLASYRSNVNSTNSAKRNITAPLMLASEN